VKSQLRRVNDHGKTYECLLFVCPGCVSGGPEGYDGVHMLPVNTVEDIGKPVWSFDGNLELPTLSPSILTKSYSVCHSYLKHGLFEFLSDSTHPLSGQKVLIPDLPDWAEELS